MDLTQIANPTPNQALLSALYPSSSPNNITKDFNAQSAAQQGGTVNNLSNQSATATGATANQNGIAPDWLKNGAQNDVPSTSTPAGNSAQNNAQANVGNTSATTQQGANQANSVLGLNSSGTRNSAGGGVVAQQPDDGTSGLVGTVAQQLGLKGLGKELTSGITSTINDFGQTLGFGTGIGNSITTDSLYQGFGEGADAVSTGFGSAIEGSGSLTGTSLSGVLGAAGMGAFGGGLLAKLTGGNETGGQIGGALGGAAGSAFLGAELGSVVPGLGTILGAAAGGLIGSLFGGGKPGTSDSTQAQYLTEDGHFTNVTTGGKNGNAQTNGFAQNASAQFGALTTAASQQLGIKWNPQLQFAADYNTLHGGTQFGLEDRSTDTPLLNNGSWLPVDSGSASGIMQGYYTALSTAAKNSGYTDDQALHDWFYGQATGGSNPAAAHNSISIAPKGSSNAGLNITPQGSTAQTIG